MKNKRSKKILSFTIISLILIIGIGIILFNEYNKNINTILKSEAYSYLPKEAKNYIEKVYEETGEVILTEKNKEENKPYLNPSYVEYVSLSDEEKEKVELIPDTYVLDYVYNENYSSNILPKSYDFRNLNQKNYLTDLKDQGGTGLCWAFATVQNAETFLLLKKNEEYCENISQTFSVRQLDYATSVNGLESRDGKIIYKNKENGSRKLKQAGNFFVSAIAMANGITLTDESVLPWNEESKTLLAEEMLNYNNSKYEVDSTIHMPSINTDNASNELINSYVADVKKYIIEYGAPFVGTYSPDSVCGFKNVDGQSMLKTDDCVNSGNIEGHAMQIIGWDDNYEYSYCESGTNHYSTNIDGTCSKGELTTGKGVWIIRNSWGKESEYRYIYLTYDSTRLSIGFITSMSDMETRNWDNNYHNNPWLDTDFSKGMASVNNQTVTFDTYNRLPEKIEKIKFMNSSVDGTYTLSITTGDKEYKNISVANPKEVGIYTYDLSDKNIIANNIIEIKIDGDAESTFFNNSISVFTSNIDVEPSLTSKVDLTMYSDTETLPSQTNPAFIKFINSYKEEMMIEHYTKNMPVNADLEYRVKLNDIDYGDSLFSSIDETYSINNYISTKITFKGRASNHKNDPICGNKLAFEVIYNETVLDSFPLKVICSTANTDTYTVSSINLHKNDGSGYYSTEYLPDLHNAQFLYADGTGRFNLKDASKFFMHDKYIKSWNTKPDGTGITYKNNYLFIYTDLNLYAQWSNPKTEPHTYEISWQCNRYICHESQILSRTTYPTFNKEHSVPINPFTNLIEGQEFIYWAFDEDDVDNIYYEEEKIINLTKYGFDYSPYNNDETESLQAIWSDSYNSVTFDANNGSGTMKGIKIIKDRTSRLKYNLFERPGYTFTGWNTKADGTGTSYIDGQKVSLTEDIKLYAQWEENKYYVTFDANEGMFTENKTTLVVEEWNDTKLDFIEKPTRDGYIFKGFFTEKTGGTSLESYIAEAGIDQDGLVFYAQWEPNKYSVTFDANGGSGTMEKQIYDYGVKQELNSVKFTKEGYVFKNWNTKQDGSGISYSDEQTIEITENITLYAQWEETYSYIINKYSYDDTKKYINKIDINTSVDDFKKNIDLNVGYSIGIDYKTINGKDLLYTGSKTRIYKNQNLLIEYTNIITGDVNSDGKISVLDIIKINNHVVYEDKKLDSIYSLAGDYNGDNKLNIQDIVKINNAIIGGN